MPDEPRVGRPGAAEECDDCAATLGDSHSDAKMDNKNKNRRN